MEEPLPAGGNVLVYARIRDPEARDRIRFLLDELPGERVNNALYEVSTEDWDAGLWDQEVERMRELVDPDADTLIYWQVVGSRLVRTCIAGRFS